MGGLACAVLLAVPTLAAASLKDGAAASTPTNRHPGTRTHRHTTPTRPKTPPTRAKSPPPAYIPPATVPYTPPPVTQPAPGPVAAVTLILHNKQRHRRRGIRIKLPRVRITDSSFTARGPLFVPARPAAAVHGGLSLVALGALLALAVLAIVPLQRRRPHGAQPLRPASDRVSFSGGRDLGRMYGDRVRVALDGRGMEFAFIALGIVVAIGLGALVAG